eukprot:Skav208372  [mRNA]  locus=scaffold1964:715201:717875:- [translate_table: standard]
MQGIATFQLDVFLADFVLGVPEDVSLGADHLAPPENREIWTAFEAKENSTNEACAALCRHTLQCFMHYVGQEGCFMAFGDHNSLETSPGPPLLLANGRRISGKVAGCGANRTEDECSMTAPLKQSIRFPGVQPDWRSKAAAIEFSLEVEAGEQKHEAEATAVFASVKKAQFLLTEPEQLHQVAQALQLAPNLEELWAYCTACPKAPAPWPRWPLAPQVRKLVLRYFVLPTLPEGAFRNFAGLKDLWLRENHIHTLPKKTFEGLGALEWLDLSANDPRLQRPAICEQKIEECFGPWRKR